MGTGSDIEKALIELKEPVNTLSGAIYTNTGILKSPIENLAITFEKFVVELNKSSEKTQKLTKWLIFWTGVMALAVIGQIITIILTNSS